MGADQNNIQSATLRPEGISAELSEVKPIVTKGSVWVVEGEFNSYIYIAKEDGKVILNEQYGADAVRIVITKRTGEATDISFNAYIKADGKGRKIYGGGQ